MCGICGIVKRDRQEPVSEELVHAMTAALAHRGPDDCGYFIRGGVGLGHRRLSIIDVAGGKQPIFNEDRSVVVILNGEIYNYRELMDELSARGHEFQTRSDTETIVHAYEQYGDDCVDRLRGMFGFAIWDMRRRRLLLARDRLGKKPVYYCHTATGFAFASEIKALLQVPGVERSVDLEALDLYLSLRYVPGPRTMFRGITKLQPGHVLVLDDTGLKTRKYWDVVPERTDPPTGREFQDFEELLEESVRLRLISEVPVGVFLSGGLDSSAVLAMMRRAEPDSEIKAYSVGYQASDAHEEEANEFAYAAQAAAAHGARHHQFELGVAQFRDSIPGLVWHLDEPLADPSCIPLYFISRLARSEITVVLSGEGADEILAGYGIYRRMLALDLVYRRFSPFSAWLAPRLAPLAPGPLAKNYLNMAGLPLEMRYRGVSRGLTPGVKQQLFPSRNPVRLLEETFAPYFKAAEKASPLSRMLYLDTKIWLPDDLLVKADKMTMATALEQRVPFLDHKLVEFAFRLGDEFKLQQGRGKHLLRRLMTGVVPQEIIDRPKKGFPVPTRSWLSGPLSRFTRELLLSGDSACPRYFNRRTVEAVVSENERTDGNRHQDVWTLLVFEFWHQIFIENRLSPATPPPVRQMQEDAN